MKRKPSKRVINNRAKKAWKHQAENGWHTITLGSIDPHATFYFDDVNSVTWTFPTGSLITVDGVDFDAFGTKVRHGKNPKKVHPARRNKEKKKTRTEALISANGTTTTIVKVDDDTWVVEGPVGNIS